LVTACSNQKIQEKQLQWRVECEQMLLKGADGLINHHDCYNRCLQHYNQYCFNRCEGALLEGDAKREDVDKHCRGYLKSYLVKKCHHLCELSADELKEYRLSYVQRIQDKTSSKSACSAWDNSDTFMSTAKKKTLDPMDDSFNQFRQPSLDKKLRAKNLRQKQMKDLPWLVDGSSSGLSTPLDSDLPWLSNSPSRNSNSSQDDDDDDSSSNTSSSGDDDDGSNQATARDGSFTDGFVPAGKISIRGDTAQIEALLQQLRSSQKAPAVLQPTGDGSSIGIGGTTHAVENEIIQSRDTAQAIKDISSMFKRGK